MVRGAREETIQLDREKHKHFVRNKYTWHAEENKETRGSVEAPPRVVMGSNSETEGYYTAEDQGFEWVDSLPELPDWLLNAIINKNVKQGVPASETTRIVGPGFAINAEIPWKGHPTGR